MKRFWILDFGFWIWRTRRSPSLNPKSKIQNLKFVLVALIYLTPSLVLAAATALPTPTPTPRPKLGGGFGRSVATPVPAADTGQSLADVVKAAGNARAKEAPPKPGVVIDNRSLVTDPTKGRLTTAQTAPAPSPRPSAPGSRTQIAPTPAPTMPAPGSLAEEQKWRDAMHNATKRLEDAKKRIEDLDAAAHKLETDFYAWDDGQYRDRVIKPSWEKTKLELAAARKELAEAEKDLDDLPERARKAGALPGWLRE